MSRLAAVASLLLFTLFSFVVVACGVATPQADSTPSPDSTVPIATQAPTPTAPGPLKTATPHPTLEPSPLPTPRPRPTATPTPAPEPQPVPTATRVPVPTATPIPTRLEYPTATPVLLETNGKPTPHVPTPTPTPPPSPIEFKWAQDGLTSIESEALEYLLAIERKHPQAFQDLIRYGWLRDGITESERRFLCNTSSARESAVALALVRTIHPVHSPPADYLSDCPSSGHAAPTPARRPTATPVATLPARPKPAPGSREPRPAGEPVTSALSTLSGNLLWAANFDPQDQRWAVYDPSGTFTPAQLTPQWNQIPPDPSAIGELTHVFPGAIYLVKVKGNANIIGLNLMAGVNLILWE